MLHADTVLFNGNIITLNPRHPHATAMAIEGSRIAFVADDETTLQLAAARTKRIDLGGRTVVPGFCDSHIHLLWFGTNLLRQADLTGAKNVDDVLARLSQSAAKTPGWIRGHGFDQSKLAENRFPTRAELDRVSKDRPIVISRICGHAGVANSAAIAQLSAEDRNLGDAESGYYAEQALWNFYAHIPPLNEDEMQQAALAACDVLLKTGITSVQTLLDTPEQMQAYTALQRAGKLPIRIVALPPYAAVKQLHKHGMRTGFGDEWLRIGAAKLFSDGSLGAQTALLSEEYTDKPGELGLRIYEPEDLKRMVLDAQSKGFSIAIHAIGDQAVNETIDAIEYALERDPLERDNTYHRHRIEHASMCSPNALGRIVKNKIVVTLQPQFVTSDTWTAQRIGAARVPWAYPFKTMVKAGVDVTLSSDCPVEWPSSFECIASAVGRHEWSPSETLTPLEAIRAYCLGSAYAGGVEKQQGSLEVGKLADFVVLSDDPTNLSAAQIRQLKAEEVWIGGKSTRSAKQ